MGLVRQELLPQRLLLGWGAGVAVALLKVKDAPLSMTGPGSAAHLWACGPLANEPDQSCWVQPPPGAGQTLLGLSLESCWPPALLYCNKIYLLFT